MKEDSLTKEVILKAFQMLSDQLAARGAKGEMCIFGGTVMVLAFAARVSTKDVDAIFQPAQVVRESAAKIAEEMELSPDWLNDAVKGYVSTNNEIVQGGLPQYPNLRLLMPTAEYLLAMKCLASRIEGTERKEGDVRDIVFLIRHLKLKSPEQVIEIVTKYYAPNRIPIKAQYLVEALFEEGQI
jgi:predicted nucleotidyltransferase